MKLIKANGQPNFGIFPDSLSDLNARDYVLKTAMGAKANPLKKAIGLKQFEYFGGVSDRFVFGCALADMRHVGAAFIYVFDMETKHMDRTVLKLPFTIGQSKADSPTSGGASINFLGNSAEMVYENSPRRKHLKVNTRKGIAIDVMMDETAANFEPMSICTSAGRRGWVYANKVAGVPVTGSITCSAGTFDVSDYNAFGHHDFSVGYMRRETFWNWACFSGLVEHQGQQLAAGLNISCGVNETSFSENALWLDGKLIPLAQTAFDYDDAKPFEPWHITSNDGQLDLTFTYLGGAHLDRLNVGFLATDFKQIFGEFNGTITLNNGETLTISNLKGFVEDHYSKW